MKELILQVKEVGYNGLFDLRDELNEFVEENFNLLLEGAYRLETGLNPKAMVIEEDYYAPDRIQIGKTRLHRYQHLKYADGHKYDDWQSPTEEQLRQTVSDIQDLIDAASEEIKKPFQLNIIDNLNNDD